MSKTVVYMLLVLALLSSAFAAELELTIHGEDGAPLSGVNVIHHELKLGASTSLDGMALVEHIPAGKHMFHISSVGYQSQMLELVFGENERVTQELILHSAVLEAAAVTVHGHSEGLVSSGTHMVEVQSTEALALNSGSTLDLLGEHEGVDTKPCALCGSAGVGLQGLDAAYTEVQQDGMTLMSGVGGLYGLDSAPTEGLARTELRQGSSDSHQSGAAIAGQVNLVSAPVEAQDTLVIRLALGDHLRHDAGVTLGGRLLHLPTRLQADWSADPQRIDGNEDQLTDTPELGRLNLQLEQRARLGNIDWNWKLRGMGEERFAGDLDWSAADRGSASVYGRDIRTRRGEGTLRATWRDTKGAEWNWRSGLVYHHQDSWYGATSFDAVQQRGLGKLSRSLAGSEWEVGLTYEDYRDNLQLEQQTDRMDLIPHAFYQRLWQPAPAVQLTTGLRVESHHEQALVPLLNSSVRWQVSPAWMTTLGAGQGYRPITLFSLDKAVHAGFDGVELASELDPEQSLSLNWTLEYSRVASTLVSRSTLRVFDTEFRDKAILAYGEEAGTVIYSNAQRAYSRGLSLSQNLVWPNGLQWKANASWSRVRYLQDGSWQREHMQNAWTAGTSLSWRATQRGTLIRLRGNFYGPQELPEGRTRDTSPIWQTWDLDLNQQVGSVDLLLSVENLFDWVQKDSPFVQDASGVLIDSAMIYGPLVGRRYKLQLSVAVL